MPSSAEADAASGRVTRSLRKRLVSIDSDVSSRPGTPVGNSLLTIPETITPAKRTTRRTSLSTPLATPTKGRGRLDINEQSNTPSRRSTRRRSTSVQEVEDIVAQNKSKEPSINVVKEEDTTERTPEPITKRVTRSSSKSPLEQTITQPKALKSPKKAEQQIITIDDSMDESPTPNATPLGLKKRTKVSLKKEPNIEEMMVESQALEEAGNKKGKKKTNNEETTTPSKTPRKSLSKDSNKKANTSPKSSPAKKEVGPSAQKSNKSPNKKEQSDVEKSPEKKKHLNSNVAKRLSVDLKKANFSNVENLTSSNSQPKQSPSTKTATAIPLNSDTPRPDSHQVVEQSKSNGSTSRKNLSFTMDILSSQKSSPHKKTPVKATMDLDKSQKEKIHDNEQSNFEGDILSVSMTEENALEPANQQTSEDINLQIPVESSFKTEMRRTSEIKNMTNDVSSSPSKSKESPYKNLRPDKIKSVAFNETADEETIKCAFPKTPGLTKSKSYILDASHDAEMETSYKSACNTVPPPVTDVESKLDKEDTKEGEEVVDGKTPYKLKLKAVESSTPITNASPKKKASSPNKKSSKEQEESGDNSFPKSWAHSVMGKIEDKIDRIEQADLSHETNISKDLSNGKPRLIRASFDGSSDEDDDMIADDVSNEDELEEEEQALEKSMFDDEAMEVAEGEESMDAEERAYLQENEVPVYGESIGSEDTESEKSGEEEEEQDEYEDDGFVVSDTEDCALAVDESDSDEDINKKPKGRKYQRIVQVSDSSNEANDLRTGDKPCLILESSEDEEHSNGESLEKTKAVEQNETAFENTKICQETSVKEIGKDSETSAKSSQKGGKTREPNEDYENIEMEEAEEEIKQWNISLPRKSANGKIREVELVATPSKDNVQKSHDESGKTSKKERKSLQNSVQGTFDLDSGIKTLVDANAEVADAIEPTKHSRKSLNKSGKTSLELEIDSKNNTSEMQTNNIEAPENINVETEENDVKLPKISPAKKQRISLNNRSVNKTVETNYSEKEEDQSLKKENLNKSNKETRKSVNKGSQSEATESAPERKSKRKSVQEVDEITWATDNVNSVTEEEVAEPSRRSQTKKERRSLNSSAVDKSVEGTTGFSVEDVGPVDMESNANTPLKYSKMSKDRNGQQSACLGSESTKSPKRKSVNGNDGAAQTSSPSQKALRNSLVEGTLNNEENYKLSENEDLKSARKEKKDEKMSLNSSKNRKVTDFESDAHEDNPQMEINTSTSRKKPRKSTTLTSTEEANRDLEKQDKTNAEESSEPEETLSASEAPSETSGRKSFNSSRRSQKSLNKSQPSLDSEEEAPSQENVDQGDNDDCKELQIDSDAETCGEASENGTNDGSVNGEEEDKSSTGEKEEEATFSETEVDVLAAERSSMMEFLGEEECVSPSNKKTKHNLSRRKSLNQSKLDKTFETDAQSGENNPHSIMEKALNQSQLRKRSIQIENIRKESECDESDSSNNSSEKDNVNNLQANEVKDRGLSLSLNNIEVKKKKLKGGEKAIRNSFTIGVSVRTSISEDSISSASSSDSSEKNELELSEQEELKKVKDVRLVEPYKSRHSLLPLKSSTIKTKEQKRIKRTSLYEQEQEASQSFVENIAKEKKKAESKEKRLSNSFCGVRAPSVENEDRPEMPKSEKKSKQPSESADKSHIQHILSRCDEILEAANRAKLQAKLNAKKIKPKKQKSINKEMKTKTEEEEVKIPLVSQKELKRKEKLKKELAKAMKHSAAMLTTIDPKLAKKIQITQSSETEADKTSVGSKRLPVELLNALDETPRPKKKKTQEITPPSDKENSKKSSKKSGLVIENVSDAKKEKKPKREILETATGTVVVEPATPEKLRFQHGFRESPKTPAGFKVQNIQSAGRNKKTKNGKSLFTASGEFVENDVSFSENKTGSNTKPKRKRKHIEEPMYSLPKTQWTSSGVFVEEDLFTARPLANSTATQFMITSLQSNKKSKNSLKPVSSTSLQQALNFKQSALFNRNVKRETSRHMLQRKERSLANKQY